MFGKYTASNTETVQEINLEAEWEKIYPVDLFFQST